MPTLGLNVKAKYQNYNIFENGDKLFEANIFYTSGSVYIYKPFLSRFNLGIGIQEEFYRGDIFRKNNDFQADDGITNNFMTNAYSYLSFDNMDDFYFPKKGTNLYAEFSMLCNFEKSNNLCPVALFKMKNVIPLSPKTAPCWSTYMRGLCTTQTPHNPN